jgi:hypothetical protein
MSTFASCIAIGITSFGQKFSLSLQGGCVMGIHVIRDFGFATPPLLPENLKYPKYKHRDKHEYRTME